jgi:NADH-quinone oxidoreductase subunit J
MELTSICFILLGAMACALSAALVTRRFPVSAAMLLITVFVVLAGMYGLLDAHFAAATQIIVYAGAIMVVFVFVIMLLNLPPEETRYGSVTAGEWLLIFISLFAAVFLGTQIGQGVLREGVEAILPNSNVARPVAEAHLGDMQSVAGAMFTEFLWPFELISFLIIASMVGAIVIAKKKGAEDAHSA